VPQKASKEHLVDAAAKAFLAVDDYDGDAFVVALAKLGVAIDIYQARRNAVTLEQSLCVIAQMAAAAGKQDGVGHWSEVENRKKA
jgi:hypothetical protein